MTDRSADPNPTPARTMQPSAADQAAHVVGAAHAAQAAQKADFAPDYADARTRFLRLASERGARIHTTLHPRHRGRLGEDLAIDIAVFGAPQATQVLFMHGGSHGMEGVCGSGILCGLLRTGFDRVTQAVQEGLKVVLLHALNPWGFSWCRRVNEDNVDLNRNFLDFRQAAAPDPDYALAHPLLFPDTWPPDASHLKRLQDVIAERGMAWWQYAVSHGQRLHPEGMFFAGNAPTWSNLMLRETLRREVRGAQTLHWIDLHTGLGPSGHGEKIYGGLQDPASVQRARECWGQDVTATFEGNSTSALIFGMAGQAAWDECPDTVYTGIALEYGTLPFKQVLDALQFDHWVHARAPDDARLQEGARAAMRAAFAVDTPVWRDQVTTQGWQAFSQAVAHAQTLSRLRRP